MQVVLDGFQQFLANNFGWWRFRARAEFQFVKLRDPDLPGLHILYKLRRIDGLLLRWHPVAVPHAGLVVVALVGDDLCRFFDRYHFKTDYDSVRCPANSNSQPQGAPQACIAVKRTLLDAEKLIQTVFFSPTS